MSFPGAKVAGHSVVESHFVCGVVDCFVSSLSGVTDYGIPSTHTPGSGGGVADKKVCGLTLVSSTWVSRL